LPLHHPILSANVSVAQSFINTNIIINYSSNIPLLPCPDYEVRIGHWKFQPLGVDETPARFQIYDGIMLPV